MQLKVTKSNNDQAVIDVPAADTRYALTFDIAKIVRAFGIIAGRSQQINRK